MNEKDILAIERDGPVTVLTLNRPEVLNALNPPLMRLLVDAVRQAAEDETVRCVVLTGAGRGFCSGGDVNAIRRAADSRVANGTVRRGPISTTEARARWLRRCAEASRMLHEMPKVTIAMINGSCAGAGLSLAAACDFRFAAASSKFRSAFTVNGMPGDYGGSWLWTHVLGPSKARQLYFLDEIRNSEAALDFGLIDRVYPDETLQAEVMALAHGLANLPGGGLAHAKTNLNAAMTETFAASLDRESLGMMLARNELIESEQRRQ